MYESLAKFVVSCAAEDIGSLYLEDIALCAAWYESHEDDAEIQAEFGPLRQVFDTWVRDVQAPRTDTEGFRQQPLIRDLIAELTEGNAARLNRDELDLIYFAVAFARRSEKLSIFRRVLSCTAPYLNAIEQCRKQRPLVPGCANLGKRLAVVTTADLTVAEARDVRNFGGIGLPVRGPVYMREGNLKVLDGIPAECTVVVDQGSCCVRGNVEGQLATTESCDILDNVSGVVIARRGSISLKNILNQSTLISKEDSVRAIDAESPKIVFAAREINLQGDVKNGRLLARIIEVGGDMHGGEIYATERVQAASFIATDGRPLQVCLLRGLSCKDYGEILTQESEMLLNSAMKLRQRLDSTRDLKELAIREADDRAGNILMYVLGEDAMKGRVQQIQDRRRRISYLERLKSGIRALAIAAEDQMNSRAREGDAQKSSPEDQSTLEELRRELAALSSEGTIDADLLAEKDEVLTLGRKIQGRSVVTQDIQGLLEQLLEKESVIQRKVEEMSQQVLGEEEDIERAMGREALLERARAECARVEMLKQLTTAARKSPGSSNFKQRLNDRNAKILLRTMENRNARVATYQSNMKEFEERIDQVKEKLWKEYKVSLPDHVLQGWAVGGARIEGRFSANVLICAWRHLMTDPSSGGRSCVITEAEGDEVSPRQIYVRSHRSTVDELVPPASDAADTPPGT